MPLQRRICLVTDGGMVSVLRGSVLQALARSASLQFHFLLPAAASADQADLRASVDGQIEVHFARALTGAEARDDSIYPPPAAFDCPWHVESLELLLALKD